VNGVSLVDVLICPDCRHQLRPNEEHGFHLSCALCGRRFEEVHDRLIDMLPATIKEHSLEKEELRRIIDSSSPAERSRYIAIYEAAFHDQQAGSYDDLFTDPYPLHSYYTKLIEHQVYDHVRDAPFIVDLCCGTGKSSIPLIARGKFVIGIDISLEMLKAFAAKCLAKHYTNFLLLRADASMPPIKEGSCKAITVIGGLHHIPEADRCISNLERVLASDGTIVLHEPLASGVRSRLSALLENSFALLDVPRVVEALQRRLLNQTAQRITKNDEEVIFTPYEKPFSSPEEVVSLFSAGANIVVLRPQGLLSFHPLPSYLGKGVSSLLSSMIVAVDNWLAKKGSIGWHHYSAILVVASKTSNEGQRP
jgi:ubiquinone/menaquinone biosynthesis C-methylase UbiE/uncharacterized protein YbaR (Trm112 family)